MSWSYSGDPTTSAKDEVRFLIGDTDSREPLLQNEEIAYVLGKYNNSPINAAIRCCETIMAKFARLVNEAVGQVKINYRERYENYRDTIADLRRRLAIEDATPYAGGISVSDKRTNQDNDDRVRPDFTKHQNENQTVGPFTSVINTISPPEREPG